MKDVRRWDVQTMDERTSSEGKWVLHCDYEQVLERVQILWAQKVVERDAEIARLRAELDNAAAAAIANMSLACEKESEADALRVDAMRYRWLIRNWQFDKDSPISLHFDLDGLDDTDKAAAAIDAAMGADA